MVELWLGYGWAMVGLWLGYGWAMVGRWLGDGWAMAGLWLDYGWATVGLWLGCAWAMGLSVHKYQKAERCSQTQQQRPRGLNAPLSIHARPIVWSAVIVD